MLTFNFTPFPQISTARLCMRKMTAADGPEILFMRSDDAVMKYIDREKTKSVEEAVAFIEKVNSNIDNNESVMWAICLASDPGRLIGTIGFWRLIPQHHRAEIGYMLHPGYWGKGIMREALLASIEFGFNHMKLHSIEAHINPDNIVSGALLEKTGFVREAYFKEDYFYKGRFIDSAIYSLLNKDDH